jgi:hypothetical protein
MIRPSTADNRVFEINVLRLRPSQVLKPLGNIVSWGENRKRQTLKLTVDEKKLYQLVKKALSEVMEENAYASSI